MQMATDVAVDLLYGRTFPGGTISRVACAQPAVRWRSSTRAAARPGIQPVIADTTVAGTTTASNTAVG
jgi:hypothetical protein